MEFRQLLQDEYLKRCRKNPRYTVSAFARTLQVDVSTLAKILKGQRRLGNRAIQKLAGRLGLDPVAVTPYIRVKKSLGTGAYASADYQQLSLDQFQIMADWYHYAMLELMTVKGFKNDPAWIAKALKVSVTEVQIAIERLTRLGMIEIQEDGSWVDTSGGFSTTISNDFTSGAFKKMQRQILEQAVQALDDVAYEKRSQTSMTMSVDTDKLPEAKELIKEFRRKMNSLLSDKGNHQEVYQLSVSLFPVSAVKETFKEKVQEKFQEKQKQKEKRNEN